MMRPDHDQTSPLADYLEQFGERYATAMDRAPHAEAAKPAPRPSRMRRFAPAVGVGSIAATAAVIYAVGASSVGDHIDIVQKASAALGQSGDILHYVTQESSHDSGPGAGGNIPAGCTQAGLAALTTQFWQTTTGPTHWRQINPAAPSATCTQPGPDGKPLTGPVEIAQHGDVQSIYFVDLRLLSTSRQKEAAPSGPQVLGDTVGQGSQDLVGSLRTLLHSGTLKVTGKPHEQDGHQVVNLVATSFEHKDADPAHPNQKPNLDLTQTTTYTVDATSFTPLHLQRAESFTRDAGKYKGTYRLVFDVQFLTWERLPRTPENLALLDIHPDGPTRASIPASEKTAEEVKLDRLNAKATREYAAHEKAKAARAAAARAKAARAKR